MRKARRFLLFFLLLALLCGCRAPEDPGASAAPEPEGLDLPDSALMRDEGAESLLLCAVSYDRDGYSLLTSLHVLVRTEAGEVDLLTLPKDTRVLLEHYDADGYTYSAYGAISGAYHAAEAAGLAERKTVEAVSTLLGGVRIDHYAFLNVVQLQNLADLFEGEIVIDIEDDISDLGVFRGLLDVRPMLTQFATYSYLNDIGGIDYLGTDPYKLRRHQQLIEAFLRGLSQQMEGLDEEGREALSQDVVSILRTDMSAQDALRWIDGTRRLHSAQILEGYENETGQNAYWIPDRTALKSWVIEHFYRLEEEETLE